MAQPTVPSVPTSTGSHRAPRRSVADPAGRPNVLLPLDVIDVDHSIFGRTPRPGDVQAVADTWDEDLYTDMVIAHHSDDSYLLIDGRTVYHALRQRGVTRAFCRVIEIDDPVREAWLRTGARHRHSAPSVHAERQSDAPCRRSPAAGSLRTRRGRRRHRRA